MPQHGGPVLQGGASRHGSQGDFSSQLIAQSAREHEHECQHAHGNSKWTDVI